MSNKQTKRIQELLEYDDPDSGRVPRTVECEVAEDLVDTCCAGDIVTVTGIVKVSSSEGGARGRQPDSIKAVYTPYLDVNMISSSKQPGGKIEILLDPKIDYPMVYKVATQTNPFRLIVNSLCPSIYGHELVKGLFSHSFILQFIHSFSSLGFFLTL